MTRRHFVMTCHYYVSLTTPIRCRRNARRHEGWRTTPLCPSARRRAGGAGDLYPPLVAAALNTPAGGRHRALDVVAPFFVLLRAVTAVAPSRRKLPTICTPY